ncbi:MAG TPA: maleylpyruvate isomerase family mycothiol-dependent enzyme [Mycobacteriales bacterium]|nr:maleylpyruvate isomerase family mycothiol-dependent enzyme [Mycobacteriales bacterium]
MTSPGPRTPPYSALVSAVRSEGEALVSAARSGADAQVETCGDWTVADLARHVWQVYANVTLYVSTRATARPEQLPSMPDGDPAELLADQLDKLVAALSETDADTPIWTWVFNAPEGAIFWARRMAHESAVHRFDAQCAHGIRQPIDAELAADGIDELIDIILPRVYGRDQVTGPTGSVALHSTDGDDWYLVLEAGGVRRSDLIDPPDVSVTGTASALLLAAYGRVPWTSLEISGAAGLLDAWSAAVNF